MLSMAQYQPPGTSILLYDSLTLLDAITSSAGQLTAYKKLRKPFLGLTKTCLTRRNGAVVNSDHFDSFSVIQKLLAYLTAIVYFDTKSTE